MRRVLIVGAGPTGTAAAIALRSAGWEPEVFEAYDESAGLRQGAFLTVAVNGLAALEVSGADSAVRGLGFPTGRIRFLSAGGRELGSMPLGPESGDGVRTRTVRRADLYASLHDLAAERGIPVHHGRRLTAAATAGGRVTATFADGSTATGELLVGADGLRSAVRRLIDPRAPSPRHSGLGNIGATTRVPGLDVAREAADGDYRMIWGRTCFFGYTVDPSGEVWWFANPPQARTGDEGAGPAEHRRRLVELLAGDAGPAAAIVAATDGPILFGAQEVLPRVPAWQRDRMVVIGDAAHAVSPATGQGVSLGWEDGATLASCLAAEPDVPRALARFERERRPRVDRVTRWGARMGTAKAPGPVGRAVRDLALPLVLARASSPRALRRQAWLYDHRPPPSATAVP